MNILKQTFSGGTDTLQKTRSQVNIVLLIILMPHVQCMFIEKCKVCDQNRIWDWTWVDHYCLLLFRKGWKKIHINFAYFLSGSQLQAALNNGELTSEHNNALNRQLCTSIRAFTDSVTKSEREHIAVNLIKNYLCLKGAVSAGHVSIISQSTALYTIMHCTGQVY